MEYKTAKRMEYLPFSGIRAVMEKAGRRESHSSGDWTSGL